MRRTSQESVVQSVDRRIDPEGGVRLNKETWVLPGTVPLSLVRKTRLQEDGGASRPAVVLVHGFAQNRYTWHTSQRSFVNYLAVRGWDVWNLELRGHGRSRLEATTGAASVQDYVDDVSRVAEALHGRAYFIGHSLGGASIYGAATQAPMAGIIGIGALFSFGRHNPAMMALAQVSHTLSPFVLTPGVDIKTRQFGGLIARLYGLSDAVGYAVPLSGWWPGSVEREILEERLWRGFDWTSAKVWLEMARWAVEGRFDYEAAWSKVDLPLLVTAGDRDHLLPPGDAKRAYTTSGSTDKTFLVFDHVHHEVHWGHLDLIIGTRAPEFTWPAWEGWLAARAV